MFHVKHQPAERCGGCDAPVGISVRVHRGNTICPRCLRILFSLGYIKEHCPEGHDFTPENTYVTAAGYWQCRECGRDNTARQDARRTVMFDVKPRGER